MPKKAVFNSFIVVSHYPVVFLGSGPTLQPIRHSQLVVLSQMNKMAIGTILLFAFALEDSVEAEIVISKRFRS